MNTATKIVLAGGVLAAVGAYSYYRNLNNLQFQVNGVTVDNLNRIGVTIMVGNPSAFWSYPVPRLIINVMDANGAYLGTMVSEQLQWIRPGASTLQAWILPEFTSLANLLSALITGANTLNAFNLNGVALVGNYQITFTQNINLQ